jgi:hypothetical protein
MHFGLLGVVTEDPSPTPSPSVTADPSPTPTVTVTAEPSVTPTVTETASPSVTPTVTETATVSPSVSPEVVSIATDVGGIYVVLVLLFVLAVASFGVWLAAPLVARSRRSVL